MHIREARQGKARESQGKARQGKARKGKDLVFCDLHMESTMALFSIIILKGLAHLHCSCSEKNF